MRLIKKKCPYCGADLEYHYGDHEAKCNSCRQSLIVEYERLPFTEVKAMLDYYKEKLRACNSDIDYRYLYDGTDDERYRDLLMKEEEEHRNKLNKLLRITGLCEQMLDEAMDDELERRGKG